MSIWQISKRTAVQWMNDKPFRLAAALAYYTLFSLAPLLVVVLGIAGLAFGEEAVRGDVFGQLKDLVGAQSAGMIQSTVAAASVKSSGLWATGAGIAGMLLGASAVFGELQDALNTIWDAKPPDEAGVWSVVKKRLTSMAMVIVIGFLLLVSLALTTALSVVMNWVGGVFPVPPLLVAAANFVVSFGVITLLFAAIYKILPDVSISWEDVWIGAAVTSVLFTVGKAVIGFYLGLGAVGSAYGAASSLVVVLLWIYYSSLILYLGAEFTQVYATNLGSRVGRTAAEASS